MVSTKPAIGEWRGSRGLSGGKLSIWARISGETFSRNQAAPSALIATDSCVRGRTTPVPRARLAAVLAAAIPLRHAAASRGPEDADFHVAETRPLAPSGVSRGAIGLARLSVRRHRAPGVAIGEIAPIAADFRAHVDLDEGRSFPLHGRYSALIPRGVKAPGPAPGLSEDPSENVSRGGLFLEYPCAMSRVFRALFLAAVLAVVLAAPLARPAAARAANLLYVSGEESGEIVVVDADKGEVAARIPVGKRPRGIKLSRDGKLLYVALSGSPRGGPGVDESKLPPGDRTADGVGVVDLENPQAAAHAGERPGSRVLRPLARTARRSTSPTRRRPR